MRPLKIGLALGSGAARGWAHIGVIRALQDMGIKPDVVTGTSIGALVGGAYSAGKLDDMEQWVRSMDRWQVFSLLDFTLSGGGMVSGERVFKMARDKFGSMQVENLKTRFAAVATDLYTGREIWLKEGDVFEVARASCAMPGLLSPKFFEDRWLVDGALVNPVPVSLARAMEADFVIAVHLNSQVNVRHNGPPMDLSPQGMEEQAANKARVEREANADAEGFFHSFMAKGSDYMDSVRKKLSKGNKSPGVVGVMAGSIDIMQERITKARMAGDPPDVLLQPKLGDIGLLEFYQGKMAIEIGYETTKRLEDLIKADLKNLHYKANGGHHYT